MPFAESESVKRKERHDASSSTEDDEPSVSPPPLKRRAIDLKSNDAATTFLSSPFKLTSVHDLKASQNHDTVALRDLLGDPLIRECWLFDFLFDVDFVMAHLDEDVRHLVKVKIVHGSWRKEDSNRIAIEEAKSRWKNVESVTAYLPEMFGTHHSKMMVLFRHDDTCEVVVHTANMIDRDWRNFTQAVWRSPRLGLLSPPTAFEKLEQITKLGSGLRFKQDLLAYLDHYGEKRTGALRSQLKQYDFAKVRAVFIASVPTKQRTQTIKSTSAWGWVGLRDALLNVPVSSSTNQKPRIVAQISSIGTLSEDWIEHFYSVLQTSSQMSPLRPDCRVMFPTADEVRRSLDGYAAGSSIHIRVDSARQQKMLARLRRDMVHWAGEALGAPSQAGAQTATSRPSLAGRRRAAPHIKTYIRFANEDMTRVDWALLTSANLSTQAWGEAARGGTARISSYETGVLVWPSLLGGYDEERDGNGEGKAQKYVMVPTFMHDMPTAADDPEALTSEEEAKNCQRMVVGLRMPYDAPLVRYAPSEMPWVASASHAEPDWQGRSWMPHASSN